MFIKYNSFALVWAIVIMFLSVVGVDTNANIEFNAMDKVVHIGIYLVLCKMLIVGFTKQYQIRTFKYYPVTWALLISAGYGISLEVVQYFLPYRSFDIYDMLANVIGAFCGWLVFIIVYKL